MKLNKSELKIVNNISKYKIGVYGFMIITAVAIMIELGVYYSISNLTRAETTLFKALFAALIIVLVQEIQRLKYLKIIDKLNEEK